MCCGSGTGDTCRHPEGRQLVTPKTAEIPAVTDHTTGLVKVQFAGCMVAQETRQVARGFERGSLSVALFAAEGIVDFGVAYQTIGHLRHGGSGDPIGLRQPAMAGLAGIRRVQVAADVARRLEIVPLVDGGGKQRCHVAHFEVLGVAEEGDAGLWGRGDLDIVILIPVTLQADGLRGQQVVGRLSAGCGRRVTGDALKLEREVELVREGGGIGHTPGRSPRQKNDGELFHPW